MATPQRDVNFAYSPSQVRPIDSVSSFQPQFSVSPMQRSRDGSQRLQQQDENILETYFNLRKSLKIDDLRQSSTHQPKAYSPNEQSPVKVQIVPDEEGDMEQRKIEIIKSIDNPMVSQMLLQRIQERTSEKKQPFQEQEQLLRKSTHVQKPQPVQQQITKSQLQTEVTCSSQISEDNTQKMDEKLFQVCQAIDNHSMPFTFQQQPHQRQTDQYDSSSLNDQYSQYCHLQSYRNSMNNQYTQQNDYSQQTKLKELQQRLQVEHSQSYSKSFVAGDQRNLQLFSFAMAASTPLKKNQINQRVSQSFNRGNERNHSSILDTSQSHSRRQSMNTIDSTAQNNKSYIEKFMENISEKQQQKYSPVQAKKSGERMYHQHQVYQQKLKVKKMERDKEIQGQMKQKPTICKKSEIILQKSQIKSTDSQISSQIQRHHNCYLHNNSQCDRTSISQANQSEACPSQRQSFMNQDLNYPQFKQHHQIQVPQRPEQFLVPEQKIRYLTPANRVSQQVQDQKIQNSSNSKQKKPAIPKPNTAQKPKTTSITDSSNLNQFQSFGPIENKHQKNQISQGEDSLKRLCQQYQNEQECQPKIMSMPSHNQVINLSQFMQQARNLNENQAAPLKSQRESKIIEKILENEASVGQLTERSSLRQQPNIDRIQLGQKLQNHKPKQQSIIDKIKQADFDQSKQDQYFNISNKDSKKPIVIKNFKPQNNDHYFQQILRKDQDNASSGKKKQSSKKKKYIQLRINKAPSQKNLEQQPGQSERSSMRKLEWKDVPLYERNLVWKIVKEQDLRLKKEMQDQQELSECNFTPRIADYVKKSPNKYPLQTQRSNNHSPLISARSINNYVELSNHKKEVEKLAKKKFPYQVKLRVLERNSSHCSSHGCSTSRQHGTKQINEKSASPSPLKTVKKLTKEIQRDNSPLSKIMSDQQLKSFLTSDEHGSISVSALSNPHRQTDSQEVNQQRNLININVESTKSLFDLSKEEENPQFQQENIYSDEIVDKHRYKRKTSERNINNQQSLTIQQQNKCKTIDSQEMEFTLMSSSSNQQRKSQQLEMTDKAYQQYENGFHQRSRLTSVHNSNLQTQDSFISKFDEARQILDRAKDLYYNM